ncbi:host cell factor 2 [Xenentodon cancila]
MSQNSPCLWTQLPQSGRAPCDRCKHACCSYEGSVFVLGGRDSSSLRDFWRYSVVYNEWTELTCSSEAAPEELEEHTMVAHEGFLYVFGGMLDSAYTRCRCALWVFDIAKQKWVPCQGKTSPQLLMPTNRKGHSSVVLGSAMLVYGGFVDIKGPSQDFWSLNFESMTWSLLSGPQRGSSGPGPRHGHSAAIYQSCMYIFGGLKGLREQRDFWKWSSSNHMWTSLKNKSGPPRLTGHSAVTYKDSMLVFGGGESQNSPNGCLWRYSFSSQTWTEIATLPGSSRPDKIHHCCAGLGPSYKSSSGGPCSGPGLYTEALDRKPKPFNNKCFPAPLTSLGSEGGIELETFSPDKSRPSGPDQRRGPKLIGSCPTFENKGFRKQLSFTEELMEEEDGAIRHHLPDLMLVLGGRPYSRHSPISTWQMTLTDS